MSNGHNSLVDFQQYHGMISNAFECKPNATILPLIHHRGNTTVFNLEKLKTLKRNETRNFTRLIIQGDNLNSVTKVVSREYSASVEVNGIGIGAVLAGSAYSQLQKVENNSFSILQTNLELFHFEIKNHRIHYKYVQDLIHDDFKEALRNVQTQEDANKLVETTGGGMYIENATFGGAYTLSAESSSSRTTNSTLNALELTAKLRSIVNARLKNAKKREERNVEGIYYSQSSIVGGDVTINNIDEWMKSINGENADIITFKLGRISNLVERNEEKNGFRDKIKSLFNNRKKIIDEDEKKNFLNKAIQEFIDKEQENLFKKTASGTVEKMRRELNKLTENSIKKGGKAKQRAKKIKRLADLIVRDIDGQVSERNCTIDSLNYFEEKLTDIKERCEEKILKQKLPNKERIEFYTTMEAKIEELIDSVRGLIKSISQQNDGQP